jgi:hypothetical protein
MIGDIFVRMAGILKIYTEYIQNFNEALSQIQVRFRETIYRYIYILYIFNAAIFYFSVHSVGPIY